MLVAGEGVHGFDNDGDMFGKKLLDEGGALGREMDINEAAVVAVSLAIDKAPFGEVIDHEGEVATAFEDFGGEVTLAEGADMVEGFEDTELADGEVDVVEMLVDVEGDGIGGAGEFDVGAEGLFFSWGAVIMCTHKVVTR